MISRGKFLMVPRKKGRGREIGAYLLACCTVTVLASRVGCYNRGEFRVREIPIFASLYSGKSLFVTTLLYVVARAAAYNPIIRDPRLLIIFLVRL